MSQTRRSASFNNAEPEDLGFVEKVDEQQPVLKCFSGEECWASAWAPDGSYFAYSQGGGIVYLLPWDEDNHRLLKRPTSDRTTQTENENNILLDRYPRISGYGTASERNSDDVCAVSECHDVLDHRGSFRIDCGDIVWSMAFGRCTSMDSIKLWRRFRRKCDLILATGLSNGKIKLWGVSSGLLLLELLDHRGRVRGLSFSPDGSFQLVSASNDCTLKFWDLNLDGNMYKTLKFDKSSWVFDCKWSPNGKQIAAVGSNKHAIIWMVSDLSKCIRLIGHHHVVSHCDYSPDGALLATSSYDTTVILWDPFTGEQLLTLGHMFPPPRPIYAGGANDHYVTGLSFSGDGQHIATTADDGYMRTWDITNASNPECIAVLPKALCCSYSPSGAIIAAGDRNGNVMFYKPPQNVVSLQHLCRMAVRRCISSPMIDMLQYPHVMKEFLKYHLHTMID